MSVGYRLKLITNRYAPLLIRVILGGIFIYAGAGKILYPANFAEAIANYQLIPFPGTNLVAIILPWVEFISGLCLLNGLKTQSSNFIIFLCLCVFTFGVVTALARGLDINCGCFSEAGRRVGFVFLAEEAGLLAMSVYIFFFDNGFFSLDRLIQNYRSALFTP